MKEIYTTTLRLNLADEDDRKAYEEFTADLQKTVIPNGRTCMAGSVSDRCELNRQIRADNALLRELKATVKKLMQAVKNTIPAIAEAMESVRQKAQ